MAGKRSRGATIVRSGFAALVTEVKGRIQAAQTRAMLTVNAELVRLYWDIGRIIHERQKREGWGAAVIPRLASELRNELPELKGFSERNIKLMLAFYREYPNAGEFVQQAVALLPSATKSPHLAAKIRLSEKVQPPVAQLPATTFWAVPWAHHVIIVQKVKDLPTRRWYMEQTLTNGWMSSNQSGEGEIRKTIIEANLVDCMVALHGRQATQSSTTYSHVRN